jgi:hypothetical protein
MSTSMSRRAWRLAAVAVLAMAGVAQPARVARADMCSAQMPDRVSDIRGYTFIGTVIEVDHPRADPEAGPTTYTFKVEDVLAFNSDPDPNPRGLTSREGGPVSLYGESCDGIRHLEVGARYLFSTSYLSSPTGPESAAWQLVGDKAKLVRMFPRLGADQLAAADTVQEALALAAPDAAPPPTDSVRPDVVEDSAVPFAIYALALGVGGWLMLRLRSRQAIQS